MEIHTVDMEPLRVLGISHSGAYDQIGQRFMELHEKVGSLGLQSAPLVAIYYDDPHAVPMENLRSVAGAIVADGTARVEGTKEFAIPGGKYAMASYVGDYAKLGRAWEEFFGSIFSSGLKTKPDVCFERYINTPMDVPTDQLITELYAPLA